MEFNDNYNCDSFYNTKIGLKMIKVLRKMNCYIATDGHLWVEGYSESNARDKLLAKIRKIQEEQRAFEEEMLK